ncbi:mucin-5AC-like, partial [Mycetomoellerius zeteki]|uniref:mucin-5AC-like n=1 Tax=Mycetomoellerius zeteki TaxID=64791 RepID=UPI00084E4475
MTTPGSRQPTLSFRATPSPSQTANGARPLTSPSYAAVTAGPSSRTTTSSTIARSGTVATSAAPKITEARRSGEAAATRKPPTTATVSKPRVVSVETVKLSVKPVRASAQNATRSARAPSHPPQRTSPEAGGPRKSMEKEKCGEGAYKKLPANHDLPVSSRTRRATSVPIEKREDTARRERVSPHPPRRKIYNISSSSDDEGTPIQPGGVGRPMRRKETGPPPVTPSSRATGNSTSLVAGNTERTPPATLPSPPTSTRGGPSGSPGETLISLSPATSLPTTLTTSTVTTTTCGSPIASTGFTGGAGRQLTPPSCLPPMSILPTIGEETASPCVAVAVSTTSGSESPSIPPRTTTPEPERGREEGRQEDAASKTPIVEGNNQWGGSWTVSVGRRARRRQHENDRSPSNSESPPTAGPSRSPRVAPLCALIAASTSFHDESLRVVNMHHETCRERTPPCNVLPVGAERRRRETSPEDHAEGDVGRTGTKVSVERPSAPAYVRGVMSRRGAAASSTVPPRANRGEGGQQHHGRRRPNAPVGQPSRDHPAPATVARQRRRERVTTRDALLDRAKDVDSIADLETFATSVAAFFGEDASARSAAGRARDRS